MMEIEIQHRLWIEEYVKTHHNYYNYDFANLMGYSLETTEEKERYNKIQLDRLPEFVVIGRDGKRFPNWRELQQNSKPKIKLLHPIERVLENIDDSTKEGLFLYFQTIEGFKAKLFLKHFEASESAKELRELLDYHFEAFKLYSKTNGELWLKHTRSLLYEKQNSNRFENPITMKLGAKQMFAVDSWFQSNDVVKPDGMFSQIEIIFDKKKNLRKSYTFSKQSLREFITDLIMILNNESHSDKGYSFKKGQAGRMVGVLKEIYIETDHKSKKIPLVQNSTLIDFLVNQTDLYDSKSQLIEKFNH